MAASRTVIRQVACARLVFGLEWFALLGNTGTREVRRVARAHKASHAVHAGPHVGSVGLATLARPPRGVLLYSAAQLVAQRFSTGAVALVLPMEPERWWFVAVHDGAVIARTDHICDSIAEAQSMIHTLRQAHPGLTVLDDAEGGLTLHTLATELYTEAALNQVSRGKRRWALWGPVLVLLLVAAWLLDAISSSGVWPRGTQKPITSRDASLAWDDAIKSSHAGRWVHGVLGTAQVANTLLDLPVRLDGWQLQKADCRATGARWQCLADYGRDTVDASNRGFLARAPEDWAIEFTPLDGARGRWAFDARGLPVSHAMLRAPGHTDHHLFSELQHIRPAFSQMVIEASQPVPVMAPVDESGQPLPRPDGLPRYYTRALRVQAPLRSLSLLLPNSEAMFWQAATLRLEPPVRPDLTSSRLHLTLQGVLYEQD